MSTAEARGPSAAPKFAQWWGHYSPMFVPILAVFTALVIGAVIIWATGKDWVAAYSGLWRGAFGSPRSIADTVIRSTPFIICGLAVALAFNAGMFNIGAEGQLYIGSVFCIVVATNVSLPAIIHIPLAIIAGAIGGALWAAIAGFLKARMGAHEVINTIMLNYIALRLTDWLIKSKTPYILGDPADTTGARSRLVAESATLPAFELSNITRLHLGIPMAIGLVFLVYWLLYKTTIGFELRTVGTNPNAAKYAGMSVPGTIVMAMAMSGALAGMAGAGEVLGVKGSLSTDFMLGVGFDSIAVALLARSNPFGIILSGLLWGALLTGAARMQVSAELSVDVIKIVQALIIMFIAADQIVRFIYRIPQAKAGETTVFSKGWGG